MPPSPQEIKARLDDAIDIEGNVLDMATVLELVTALEKTPLSKEALETTRIGKVINLMRKKTENEALATRAKKLVKKWQKLVNNHFKQLKQGTTALPNSPVPSVNGINRKDLLQERPRSCPDLQVKTPRQRQLAKERSNSPIVKTVTADAAQETVEKPPPSFNGTSLAQTKEGVESAKETLSADIPKESKSTELLREQISVASSHDETCSLNNNEKSQLSNSSHCDPQITAVADRASPDCNQSLDTRPINDDLCSRQSTLELNESDFTEVEPETLEIHRRPIGDIDPVDVETQADGINGCYSVQDTWCQWTDTVSAPNDQLLVFPYINLQ